ncbi:MAG: D-cysteine desulfhydrase family protein [Eubacteriaceae bacterium]|jgi:D-cysteine desulfhydrase family pyridoxal phosphate-dependent enzyme|nr:D-cysteine desulfhydrase family protein [Eubacteriaceae bacterium]
MKERKKIPLGQYPTPLCRLEGISRMCGLNVWIKRDDLCGALLGGNKVRKLEYLLKDAIDLGCDTVITIGGAQSNHAALTAALCLKLGLEPRLVLKKRGVSEKKGNVLLEEIMGVQASFVDTDSYSDIQTEVGRMMDELRALGKRPYFIPVGGSTPLGALGYRDCVQEMQEQAKGAHFEISRIVCATGSGGSQAGLVLGASLFGHAKVTGIAVDSDPFENIVADIATKAAEMSGAPMRFAPEEIDVRGYVGEGYGIPSQEGSEAVRTMAREEGILLDPVYTGKAFGGLLDLARKGYFAKGENIVFLHSGGSAALFAIPLHE